MIFNEKINIRLKVYWIKIMNWEYWPFHIIYMPIFIYWVYLSFKSKSFFFFSTSNPNIKNGGFLMESKFDIYQTLPEEYYPKTILVNDKNNVEKILSKLKTERIDFPIIAKPDIGMRGLKVKLLNSVEDLKNYHSNVKFNYLLQEYISYRNEVGIFYVKYPNHKQGKITGIVGKEFLTVKGDGISSIEKLIKQNNRFLLQLKQLKKTDGDILPHVLPLNEIYLIVPYGNHSRGAKFIDLSHLIDEQLSKTINTICQSIPEFYYGRLDMKYNNWESLKSGKDFSIIEVNGAGSEPTHIYDPKHSIFYAWREILKHCKILFEISMENKNKSGAKFMNTKEGLNMLKENQKQLALLA